MSGTSSLWLYMGVDIFICNWGEKMKYFLKQIMKKMHMKFNDLSSLKTTQHHFSGSSSTSSTIIIPFVMMLSNVSRLIKWPMNTFFLISKSKGTFSHLQKTGHLVLVSIAFYINQHSMGDVNITPAIFPGFLSDSCI